MLPGLTLAEESDRLVPIYVVVDVVSLRYIKYRAVVRVNKLIKLQSH